jgi:GntR family transcriptional regulator
MHLQLAERLRQSITNGVYKPGDRIATEPELIERYAVSRITARQAVNHLVREGLVIRKQGKGTFVAGPVVRHDLLDMRGIYDEMLMQGLRPRTRLLTFAEVVPPPRVAARLQTGGRKLIAWRRIYRLDGKPFGLSWVHLNSGGTRISRQQASAHPTYAVLEQLLGLQIERADIAIRYQRATPELSRVLGVVARAPMMVLERVSYSSDGAPREHTLYYAKAEAYEFSINVRGKIPITSSLASATRTMR